MPVTMLVAVDWQMKLSGLVSGDLHYKGNDQGGGAKGQLAVNHGKFNVLPWLGKVTAMVGLQDITDVEVDKATTDFEWKDRALHLTNHRCPQERRHPDRRRGRCRRDRARSTASSSSACPHRHREVAAGADAGLPRPARRLQLGRCPLTGTPDHLQEDLTPRLLAAGLDQGSDLLNQAAQKATRSLQQFHGQVNVIRCATCSRISVVYLVEDAVCFLDWNKRARGKSQS